VIEKILHIGIVAAFVLPVATLGQAGSTTVPSSPLLWANKIGTINVQSAILATNDGQKDLQALEKKFDPKKSELKSLSNEINTLKKQLETQDPKLNDDARANLARQIDSKQKTLGRTQEKRLRRRAE